MRFACGFLGRTGVDCLQARGGRACSRAPPAREPHPGDARRPVRRRAEHTAADRTRRSPGPTARRALAARPDPRRPRRRARARRPRRATPRRYAAPGAVDRTRRPPQGRLGAPRKADGEQTVWASPRCASEGAPEDLAEGRKGSTTNRSRAAGGPRREAAARTAGRLGHIPDGGLCPDRPRRAHSPGGGRGGPPRGEGPAEPAGARRAERQAARIPLGLRRLTAVVLLDAANERALYMASVQRGPAAPRAAALTRWRRPSGSRPAGPRCGMAGRTSGGATARGTRRSTRAWAPTARTSPRGQRRQGRSSLRSPGRCSAWSSPPRACRPPSRNASGDHGGREPCRRYNGMNEGVDVQPASRGVRRVLDAHTRLQVEASLQENRCPVCGVSCPTGTAFGTGAVADGLFCSLQCLAALHYGQASA